MLRFLAKILFGNGQRTRPLTDREEFALHDKGKSLLENANSFNGMAKLVEQAEELRSMMPDNYMFQVIGAGSVIRKDNGLILSYVDKTGKVVRFKISCSYT